MNNVGSEHNDFFNGVDNTELSDIDVSMKNYIDTINMEPQEPQEPSFWESDIEVIDSCGNIKESIDVVMLPVVIAKIDALMNKYNKMEWLAYLIGDKETNTIIDIVVPKQVVTPVNVFVKGNVDVPIIGVIHSHHDMGNNFSHTDDEYINANHNISLCVSKSGIQGQVRVKTECIKYILVNANVKQWNGGVNITSFLEESDKLIKVKHHNEPKHEQTSFGAEPKDIQLYVSEYHEHLKDLETSDILSHDDHVEIMYMVTLLSSVNTPDFFDNEDFLYNGKLNVSISNQCISLVDEIDVFYDELTNNDYVSIAKLLVYLKGLDISV